MSGSRLGRVMAIAALAAMMCAPVSAAELIEQAEVGYPTPAFPYYHFRADLDIEDPSMLDVEAAIDGEPMRFVDLRDGVHALDTGRPVSHYRAPGGYVHAPNNWVYERPYIVGWLDWQPGETYELRVRARLRTELEPSDDDVIIEESVTLHTPADAEVFDPAWKNHNGVVVTETAGVDRENEPIELVKVFYAEQAENIENDLRVVAFDPDTHEITEVPSQVFDVRRDALDADPLEVPHPDGAPREVRTWVETTTARVLFQADAAARESRVYLIYYNNPEAEKPDYTSSLDAGGPLPGIMVDADDRLVDKPGYTIENDEIRVMLHPLSGLLHELELKAIPDVMLEHKMETNGSIHWTPEAWPPPRPWSHASDWKEPRFDAWTGPVGVITHLYDSLPYVPEVDASVTYEVFEGLPYIMMTSSTRFRESLPVLASRTMEMVIRRGLLTHLAWYDEIHGEVKTVNLDEDLAELDLVLMDSDVSWLTFFNPETGIALGGVQLESFNFGVENRWRAPNPYFYVTVGPWVYWANVHYLSGSGKSSGTDRIVEVPQGTHLGSRMALVLYELDDDGDPHSELVEWGEKLANPLRVRVAEQVTDRMPTEKAEIYIDPTRTGWEDYEIVADQ